MASRNTSGARGWRRISQFRLRSLLLMVTLLSVLMIWGINRANRQRRAFDVIDKVSGTTFYDYEVMAVGMAHGYYEVTQKRKWWMPEWAERTIYADIVADIVVADLKSSDATDEDLGPLLALPRLRYLGLGGTRVTSKCVPMIKQMKHLELLELNPTHLRKEDIKDIQLALPNCEILSWSFPE